MLTINRTFSMTLTDNLVYQPPCTGAPESRPSAIITSGDPFYSSVSPQLYAIGCMTVVSYVLVIILFITPRTFYIGGPGGGGNFLGRHGVISGSYRGSSSVVGVGGRPWLQKVAAVLVASSLTIATVDSLHVAERQYNRGYTDSAAMIQEVMDGIELRVVRVVSSTFLWLAQVQTLIRLFPRHKEKVMIKWVGFALIVLDTTFAILDNFVVGASNTHPRLFEDAIPALAYLFELALNLLYAAWVIFYSLSKHRFAFFHPKMRNICLVALLSLSAVLIPVVFFILDISSPNVSGWGEYIRWVGSTAASVVVWEWVERIEALERDERKDGILGREIFDGDEMLEVTPSEEVDWPRPAGSRGGHDGGRGTGATWGGVMGLHRRQLRRTQSAHRASRQATHNLSHELGTSIEYLSVPPAAASPVSRAETSSVASTVYYVRYHTVTSPTPPIDENAADHQHPHDPTSSSDGGDKEMQVVTSDPSNNDSRTAILPTQGRWWLAAANFFTRRRTSPPQEVANAQERTQSQEAQSPHEHPDRSRASGNNNNDDHNSDDSFSENQADGTGSRSAKLLGAILPLHWRGGSFSTKRTPKELPVTVIPPRERSRPTWSSPAPAAARSPRPPPQSGEEQTAAQPSPAADTAVVPPLAQQPQEARRSGSLDNGGPVVSSSPSPRRDSEIPAAVTTTIENEPRSPRDASSRTTVSPPREAAPSRLSDRGEEPDLEAGLGHRSSVS